MAKWNPKTRCANCNQRLQFSRENHQIVAHHSDNFEGKAIKPPHTSRTISRARRIESAGCNRGA